MLQRIYGQHKLDLVGIWVFVLNWGGYKGGRVDLGGMGSECDGYIAQNFQIIKISCWEKKHIPLWNPCGSWFDLIRFCSEGREFPSHPIVSPRRRRKTMKVSWQHIGV